MKTPALTFTMGNNLALVRRRLKHAFSLIEIVLALSVVSSGLLCVIGLMARGLDSVSASNNGFAIANITRSLRATFEATPYSQLIGLPNVTGTTYYYTREGYPTQAAVNTSPSSAPFYTVVCAPASTSQTPASLVSSANAAVVVVKVGYPYPSIAQNTTFSLFLAQ